MDDCQLSFNEIEERKIYTHLRLIVRCATNATPKTSPIRARRIQDKKRHGKAYYVRFGSEDSDVAISIRYHCRMCGSFMKWTGKYLIFLFL